jgi:LCP family protein required for cell wall assembly
MKTGSLLGKFLIGLIVVGILMSTVFVVGAAYRRGLGPALEPVAPTATPAADLVVVVTTPTFTSTPPPVVVSTAAPLGPAVVCGESTAWNLLILGADTVALRGNRGADLTRVIRLDFPNRKVTVYAFSRDLWVNTSGMGLNNPTLDATELGTVFYEADRRSNKTVKRELMVDGTNAMAKMLNWNFSVRSDHYMVMDAAQLPAMIDAVGGVPINIPVRTTDPYIGMVFNPGQQTLTGAQALAYARAIPDSDFGRINRQQLLLDALRQKMMDPAVWVKIPALYTQFNQSIVTDLSPEQINHLACLLNEIPTGSIVQTGVQQAWTSAGPQGSVSWDKNNVMNHLKELGLIP